MYVYIYIYIYIFVFFCRCEIGKEDQPLAGCARCLYTFTCICICVYIYILIFCRCEIVKEDQPLAGCARYLAALYDICQQPPGLLMRQTKPVTVGIVCVVNCVVNLRHLSAASGPLYAPDQARYCRYSMSHHHTHMSHHHTHMSHHHSLCARPSPLLSV